MYCVILSCKSGYVMHSCHATREKAIEWRECKEHDGEDTKILYIDLEQLPDIVSLIETIQNPQQPQT